MKVGNITSFGLWSHVLLLLSSHQHLARGEQQQPLLSEDRPRLRNATLEDVGDIATVIIAAFSPLSDWQYLYEFSKEFPKEHSRCIQEATTQALLTKNWHAEVVEAPANSTLSVAAVAIWKYGNTQGQTYMNLISDKCEHRDLNMTKAIDYDHKFTTKKRKYVEEAFGTDQVYLQLLGTHPDYQLRGAGTRLVKQGIQIGKRENVNVTLIAQPTAETFYLRLGFSEIVNITITSVDDDESFLYNVMAYKSG